jgi:DNA repair protein SbcC/Rad50
MKILAIRIKNLASLEGETTIDFTTAPLNSAGIFAITGPTGAGKSTILDALCLALYAETPRYNKSADPNQTINDISGNTITQSDPRGILRDGAGEGWAEVDFLGVDGNKYRSRWAVRRARNKAEGALQPYTFVCKNLDKDTDIQGTKSEQMIFIAQKIGLSFDQFTRAVLLAQGDFTAFLKAPNSEKSDLLEKLTGTQVYSDISKRIFDRHKQEKEELEKLTALKEGLNTLTEEELELLKNRVNELVTIILGHKKNETALAQEIIWFEQLEVLQQKLSQSNSLYELALLAKKDAQPREEKLRKVEQVQPARIWVQNLANGEKQYADKEKLQLDLNSKISHLQEQKSEQEKVLQTAREKLDSTIKAQSDAKPLLEKSRELDVQLKERNTNLLALNAGVKEAKEALDKQNQQVTTQQKSASELNKTIGELQTFLEEHKSRESLAVNHKWVLAGLSDAQKFRDEEIHSSKEIKICEDALLAGQNELGQQAKAFELVKDELKKLFDKQTPLQNNGSAADYNLLQKEKGEADAALMALVQASADWKSLFDVTNVLESNKKALQKSQKDKATNEKNLSAANQEWETSQTLRDAAARSLDIAKLAAAKDVVSLREQLTSGDACPVCGSTEHPYSEHDPRLNHVLTELEAEYNIQVERHNSAIKAQAALQQKAEQLANEISNFSNDLILRENEIIECRKNWIRFAKHAEADDLPAEEVAELLNQQQQEQKKKQDELNRQLEIFQKQQQQLEELKIQYNSKLEQHRSAEDALKDKKRELTTQQERLEQAREKHLIAVGHLAATKTNLNSYFTRADWFDTWMADAETFTKGLNKFALEWETKTTQLQKAQNDHSLLLAALQGLEKQQLALKDELEKRTLAASHLKSECDKLLAERQKIFGGRPAEEVEQQLKTAVDQAREKSDKDKIALDTTTTEITRSAAQLEEVQKELQRLKDEVSSIQTELTQWLNDYYTSNGVALPLEELKNLLALPSTWLDNERKFMEDIKTTILQTETVLNENKSALQKHNALRLSERAKETIAELHLAAKKDLDETIREEAEVNLRLRQDAENRTKVGAMLQQIEAKEKVMDNWAKLNLVIGSADGKKFRQIAQEYTLDVLLVYTNVQLEMLTHRYMLQRIAGSLGLQVIDKDMGNEVRSVNSISGGESFLVSLALALGLASLSSSKMQVESLFIDEGFGSLDPDTLNIAMDALERLHNQGRKVGVISHVQEMTERIPVQIRVGKVNGGKSEVGVIG